MSRKFLHVSAFWANNKNYGASLRFEKIIQNLNGNHAYVAPNKITSSSLRYDMLKEGNRIYRYLSLVRILHKEQPEVVVSDFLPTFLFRRSQVKRKIYLIHDIRLNTVDKKNGLKSNKAIYRYMISKADEFIVPSEYTKRLLQSYIDKPIKVLPSGIDYSLLVSPVHKIYRSGYICAVEDRKNIGLFFDAITNLEDKSINWILVDDIEKLASKFQRQIKKLGRKLKIYSKVSEFKKYDLLSKTEVYVSTSRFEGFGLPIAEGLASGCAAVLTDIQAHKEVVSYFEEISSNSVVFFGLDTNGRQLAKLIAKSSGKYEKSLRISKLSWPIISDEYRNYIEG